MSQSANIQSNNLDQKQLINNQQRNCVAEVDSKVQSNQQNVTYSPNPENIVRPKIQVKQKRNKNTLSKTLSYQGTLTNHFTKNNNTAKHLGKLQKYSSKVETIRRQKQSIYQQQQNRYKDLSSKLQSALKKISSQKKQQGGGFDKCKTQKLIHRFNQHERKKQKQLQQKRRIQQQKKYFGVKEKPDINQKSRQIAQDASYKPIYERFQKIMENKKKKIEEHQESKKIKQQEEYQKFLEEYNKHVKLQKQDCRNSEAFFNDMINWKSKIDKQVSEQMNKKKQKQVEGLTFQPLLNKKSIKLAQKTKRIPIQDRQILRPKTQQPQLILKQKHNKNKIK